MGALSNRARGVGRMDPASTRRKERRSRSGRSRRRDRASFDDDDAPDDARVIRDDAGREWEKRMAALTRRQA